MADANHTAAVGDSAATRSKATTEPVTDDGSFYAHFLRAPCGLGSEIGVEQKVTFCRICEPLCGMVATVEDGRVVKLRPDRDHPLSAGYACPKGIAMADVQNDPDRVTHPLRRTRDGEFERVSWDTAMEEIATRLGHVPPASVGWYMGNPGAFSYSHTLWVKGFLDGLGSPHYYSAGSQDVNNRFAASALLYGTPLLVPIPDLKRTRLLLMVGANPLVSHGSLLSAPRVREQLLDSSAWWWSTRVAPRPPASSSTCRSGPTPMLCCCSRCWP